MLSAPCSSDSLSFAHYLRASAAESPRYAPASQHPGESASATSNHLFLRCLKSDPSPIEIPPVGEIINIKHLKVVFEHLHIDAYSTFTASGKQKRSAAVAYSQEIHSSLHKYPPKCQHPHGSLCGIDVHLFRVSLGRASWIPAHMNFVQTKACSLLDDLRQEYSHVMNLSTA